MGGAFYLWDIAMKRGDPRIIGVLAYATPLLSTLLLVVVTGRVLSPALGGAALLVIAAAAVASSAPRR
jgi:drug/metabolite transporter (DMT)-like permease